MEYIKYSSHLKGIYIYIIYTSVFVIQQTFFYTTKIHGVFKL